MRKIHEPIKNKNQNEKFGAIGYLTVTIILSIVITILYRGKDLIIPFVIALFLVIILKNGTKAVANILPSWHDISAGNRYKHDGLGGGEPP